MPHSDDPHAHDATRATHYVLGGGHVGRAITRRLRASGTAVVRIDDDAAAAGAVVGDPSALEVLEAAGVETAAVVIVATGSDRRNHLIAELVRARFDVPRVVPFVHDPDRVPVFEDAGLDPFCVTTALADTVGDTV